VRDEWFSRSSCDLLTNLVVCVAVRRIHYPAPRSARAAIAAAPPSSKPPITISGCGG
jgi:hypothetical protein